MATLVLKNLVKTYGGRRVVDAVDLEVSSGTVTGLLGPNGAGKTTSFYMAIGMIRPDEGTVLLDGVDITAYPMHQRAREGIGYLPQESSIFGKLTVRQNIMAILELLPIPDAQKKTGETCSWKSWASAPGQPEGFGPVGW
jgi:lipopolysaccharide export system ATP-binding protein